MPCFDDDGNGFRMGSAANMRAEEARADAAARAACEMARHLELLAADRVFDMKSLSDETRQWLKRHQSADERRAAKRAAKGR